MHFSGGVFKDPFFELDDLATAAAATGADDSAASVRAVWYRHSVSSSELGTWIRLGLGIGSGAVDGHFRPFFFLLWLVRRFQLA